MGGNYGNLLVLSGSGFLTSGSAWESFPLSNPLIPSTNVMCCFSKAKSAEACKVRGQIKVKVKRLEEKVRSGQCAHGFYT